MRRRRTFVLALVGLVALVSVASAKQHGATGKVTIAGSGNDWKLTFANDAGSTGPIRCWRYTFPPGVQAAGIGAPPAGWSVGGSKPPPAPILGGKSAAGIPPGGAATFPIKTDKPFDTSGPPGIAAISEDCVSDGAAPVAFAPPPPPPPPPPPAPAKPKCQCKKLQITEGKVRGFDANELAFDLRWKLTCKPKKGGGGCTGKLEVVPLTPKFAIEVIAPKDAVKTCTGKCKSARTGLAAVRVSGRFGILKSQVIRFRIKMFCLRNDTFVSVGSQTVEVAFGEDGRLDEIQSDLNADGTPDGDERPR